MFYNINSEKVGRDWFRGLNLGSSLDRDSRWR